MGTAQRLATAQRLGTAQRLSTAATQRPPSSRRGAGFSRGGLVPGTVSVVGSSGNSSAYNNASAAYNSAVYNNASTGNGTDNDGAQLPSPEAQARAMEREVTGAIDRAAEALRAGDVALALSLAQSAYKREAILQKHRRELEDGEQGGLIG